MFSVSQYFYFNILVILLAEEISFMTLTMPEKMFIKLLSKVSALKITLSVFQISNIIQIIFFIFFILDENNCFINLNLNFVICVSFSICIILISFVEKFMFYNYVNVVGDHGNYRYTCSFMIIPSESAHKKNVLYENPLLN